MTNTIVALDVDILVAGRLPRHSLFKRWTARRILPNTDAEYLCLALRKVSSVALLSCHASWINRELKRTLEASCYNWLIPMRTQDEFELFRDVYFPYKTISNIPKAWHGEYSGVFSWATWQNAFDLVREDVPMCF